MHTHNAWMLFAIYAAAVLFVFWWRASKSAKSRHSPWETVRDYYFANAPDVLMGWVIATVLFKGLWDNPEFFISSAAHLGLGFAWPFALNDWTAVLYGLASDKIADLVICGSTAMYCRVRKLVS